MLHPIRRPSVLGSVPRRVRQALRAARQDDRGASVVETVIIAAGLAALALTVMATIKLLVDAKVASISL